MTEKIAVVGPRKGADKATVELFTRELYRAHPEVILLSGGAEGVDTWAEETWLLCGGTVWSYRIRQKSFDHWVVERWELSPGQARIIELIAEPSWADPTSALFYRSMLVAEAADRVCAFSGIDRMRGTEFTMEVSSLAEQKETWLWDGGWERLA